MQMNNLLLPASTTLTPADNNVPAVATIAIV